MKGKSPLGPSGGSLYRPWAAVSAGLNLVVLLAIEKPFMCISGYFEQIKS